MEMIHTRKRHRRFSHHVTKLMFLSTLQSLIVSGETIYKSILYINYLNIPTIIFKFHDIFSDLQVNLVKEIFEIGIKSSSSKYLEIPENYQEHTVLFLIDLSCSGADEVLRMVTLFCYF